MNVVQSHNVFLNTSEPTSGSSRQAEFLLPQGVIAANPGEHIKLSLMSFSMKANSYYGVSKNSSHFYVLVKDNANAVAFGAGQIAPGNYHLFQGPNGLVAAVQAAITNAAGTAQVGLSANVSYDLKTGLMNVAWNGLAAGSEVKIICFTTLDSDPKCTLCAEVLALATPEQRFSSAFEILGGPNQEVSNVPGATKAEQFDNFNSILDSTGATGKGALPMRLTDLENIYVRTNLPASNWQSSDFSTGSQRLPNFQLSNILAKIHIGNPVQDDTFSQDTAQPPNEVYYYNSRGKETIYFQDSGSKIWNQVLPMSSLNALEIRITDEYNRLIPGPTEISEEQNLLGAEMAICVDVVQ